MASQAVTGGVSKRLPQLSTSSDEDMVRQSPKRPRGQNTVEQSVELSQPEEDYVSSAELSHDPVEVCNAVGLKLSRLLGKMRNKLTHPGQIAIEDYFANIRDLAVHLHQENIVLKSKLSERAAGTPVGKELLQTCQNAMTEIAKSAKIISAGTPVQTGRPSYAAMAAVAPPVTVQGQGRKVAKPRDKCTALIYPKDSTPNTSSETTKALIQMTVKPQVMGLKIRRISKIRNNGVALEIENAEQLRKLEEIKKLRCVLNIEKPKKRRPKVLRYGHMAKDCKSEVDVCGHCAATGHETKACPSKGDKSKA
ncbi:hypothetical protein J6590_101086 [Homalodisca vitripennis]|nr:hypothetical protein J6590_101086 [Homalodisca vitripennis]